ncbi:hypothetical protein FSP39_003923 [Pinctada imbricata]|uniref:Nucleotide-diphospho-sugar transferase domain-containing protein n=1 Tax=Pinctada imbricata TaxID=66713 RepID=A0AA89BS62_PINIB|nr:hypothetical protein FSP39_003923 [Pinctada imbricata]
MTTFRLLTVTRLINERKLCVFVIFGTMVMTYAIFFSNLKQNTMLEYLTQPERSEVLTLETASLSKMALDISKEHTFVMVTLINAAYIPFTLSWLCNTKHMNINQHVLFLTTDEQTDNMLKKYWPGVKSVVLQGIDSKGNETYSQVGYVKLMVKRTEALMSILEENVPIFLFEVDCLWLKNPVPFLLTHQNFDIVSTKVSNRDSVIAGGFLYLSPNESTKRLWKELTRRMIALYNKIRALPPMKLISEGDNDQQYLSALIRNKYKGIKVKLLDAMDFPDGQWYKLSKEKRQLSKPYIINNNWVVGNFEKIKRAKKWKHWFLKEDNTCDGENLALLKEQR